MCLNVATCYITVVGAYNNGQSSYRLTTIHCNRLRWKSSHSFADWLAAAEVFGEIIRMAMLHCHESHKLNVFSELQMSSKTMKFFHLEQFVNIWYLSGQAKFGQGNLLYIIQWRYTIEMNIQTISIPYHKH